MTSLTQAYPLKIPQETRLRQQLDWLRELVLRAAQQLLAGTPFASSFRWWMDRPC